MGASTIEEVFERAWCGRAFVQVKEAAHALSISERSIRNGENRIQIGDRVLKATTVGGRLMFYAPDLTSALAAAVHAARVRVDSEAIPGDTDTAESQGISLGGKRKTGRPRRQPVRIEVVEATK